MDETLVRQVCSVLDKYDKGYTDSGVNANLESWANNKGWLVDLLRRHPNWNEEALAVIFEVAHNGEIDKAAVDTHAYELCQMIKEMDIPETEKDKYVWSLRAASTTYSKTLPGADVVSIVKGYSGVSCSAGQKTSRVINAICKRYGVDRHPEYNARFARLADSLNPLKGKHMALLSVHPCDYLEMSNRKNSWSSCHCLDAGEYHGGTLSYMNDECSMIFYTVDEGVIEDFHTARKHTRQVFCFHSGLLLQSRLYPQTDDNDTRDMYRNIVQRTIADCLMVPNLWTLKRAQDEINRFAHTHSDALHYPDYEYEVYKPNISALKELHDGDDACMIIGHTVYCLACASIVKCNNTLYCVPCRDDGYVNCSDCERQIRADDACNIDGNYYCVDCCSYCDECETYTTDFMTVIHDSLGNIRCVCQACMENYSYCEGCDSTYPSDEGDDTVDGFRCNYCLSDSYSVCDGCIDTVNDDDLEEIDGNYYCKCCASKAREDREESEVTSTENTASA